MRALCPHCGKYHELLDVDREGEAGRRDPIYEVAPHGECWHTTFTGAQLREASERLGLDETVADEGYPRP